MRSFEIQTYTDGRWKMDSVFDDRELALHEAKKIDASARYSGVRVIEENYDEATDKVSSRTLFRGGAAKGEKALNPVSASNSRKAAQRGGGSGGRDPARKGHRRQQKNNSNLLVVLLIALVILMGGILALLALPYLS